MDTYSLERRRERYLVLYAYKVILGITPNLVDDQLSIKTVYSERRGLSCVVPPIRTSATSRIKTAVERSFAIRAPMLFNSLPVEIRSSNLNF